MNSSVTQTNSATHKAASDRAYNLVATLRDSMSEANALDIELTKLGYNVASRTGETDIARFTRLCIEAQALGAKLQAEEELAKTMAQLSAAPSQPVTRRATTTLGRLLARASQALG